MLAFETPTNKQLQQWNKITNRSLYGIAITRQGNFTIASTMCGPVTAAQYVGVAKLNPNADEDIPERGEAIAIAKAARMANAGARMANAGARNAES